MSLLSKDKVREIRQVLAQVNVSKICENLEVKRRKVYCVLAGESSDYETLSKVVKAARKILKEKKKQEQELQSL